MVLRGRISTQEDGLTISTRAMVTQIHIMKTHTDNIANFGVPGYQSKEPVLTTFVEHLGPSGVDEVVNKEVGRLRVTGNPLDTALTVPGYFQRLNKAGNVELSRDGRFRLDKDGNLLSVDNKPVLSNTGVPIQLPFIPMDIKKQLNVSRNGQIQLLDLKTGSTINVARLGIVNPEGTVLTDVDVAQNYVEDSNVYLQKEYTGIMPLRRQFEANRQLFLVQSDALSRMIQDLSRGS
ncbi:MAG: hypothetical protein KTR14_08335 [Vampirovibrio sp.]|nr:hypothetical protein [Vampirovibrio sp.]